MTPTLLPIYRKAIGANLYLRRRIKDIQTPRVHRHQTQTAGSHQKKVNYLMLGPVSYIITTLNISLLLFGNICSLICMVCPRFTTHIVCGVNGPAHGL